MQTRRENALTKVRLIFSVKSVIFCCVYIASCAAYGQNLILNGSAELKENISFPWAPVWALQDWTKIRGTDWPADVTEVPAQDGDFHFFARGSYEDSAEIAQIVDLTPYITQINNGEVIFKFSGYTRSFSDPSLDQSRIGIQYQTAGFTTLNSWRSGWVSSVGSGADKGEKNGALDGWTYHEVLLSPSPGTVQAYISIESKRLHGEQSDGYADNLWLEPTCNGGTLSAPSQTCEGEDLIVGLANAGGTRQWQANYAGAGWNDIPETGIVETFNLTVAQSPAQFRVVSTYGVCQEPSNEISVIVNSSEAGMIPESYSTICEGELVELTNTGAVGTVEWQKSIGGGPWLDQSNSTSQYSDSPTELESPVKYRVKSTTGVCVDSTNEIAVSIINAAGGTVVQSKTEICEGDSIELSVTGQVGMLKWQERQGVGVWSDMGDNLASIFVKPTSSGSWEYRTHTTAGSCSDSSDVVGLTVNTNPTAGILTSSSNFLCTGEPVDFNLVGSSGIIQWQRADNAGTYTDFGTGLNSETITPSISESPVHVRVVSENNACFDTTNVENIVVAAAANAGDLTLENQLYCEGDSALGIISNHTGSVQWRYKPSGGSWVDYPVNGDSAFLGFTHSQSPVEVKAYVSVGTCLDSSTIATITIHEAAEAGELTANQASVCEGELIELSLAAGNGTIVWESSSAGSPFGQFGGSSNMESDSPTELESVKVYRSIRTTSFCSDTSNELAVVIASNPQAGNISFVNDEICQGQFAFVEALSASGTLQWQYEASSGVWVDFGGGYVQDTLLVPFGATTMNVRLNAVAGSCADISETISLVIHELPSAGNITGPSEVCQGTVIETNLTSSSGTIKWEYNEGATWQSSLSTIDTLKIGPFTSLNQIAIRAITEENNCYDTTAIHLVDVVEGANAGDLTLTEHVICLGEIVSLEVSNELGTISWQQKRNNGTWLDTNVTGPMMTAKPRSDATQMEFRVYANNGTCSDTSSVQTLTIIPLPTTGNLNLSDVLICDNDSSSITIDDFGGTLQWERNPAGDGWSTFGSGQSEEVVKGLSGESPLELRVVVTENGCSDTTEAETLLIQPGAYAGDLNANYYFICEGDSVTVQRTNTFGSLSWHVKLATGDWVSVPSDLSSNTIYPSVSQSPVLIKSSSENGLCRDTSEVIAVEVTAFAYAGELLANGSEKCEGDEYVLELPDLIGGAIYESSTDQVSWSQFGGNQSTEVVTIINEETKYIRAIAQSGTCLDTSNTVNYTSYAINAGTLSLTDSVLCEGSSTDLIVTGYSGSLRWEESNDGLSWEFVANTTDNRVLSPSYAISPYFYRVVANNGPCFDTTEIRTLSIQSLPSNPKAITGDEIGCAGSLFNISSVVEAGVTPLWEVVNGTIAQDNGDGTMMMIGSANPVQIQLLLENNCGQSLNVAEFEIEIIDAPEPVISPAVPVLCEGGEVYLYASDNLGLSGPELEYEWYVDGVLTATGDSLSITNESKVFVESNYGKLCYGTSDELIVIEEVVDVEAGANQSVNEGEIITLEATSNGIYNYEWSGNVELTDNLVLTPSK